MIPRRIRYCLIGILAAFIYSAIAVYAVCHTINPILAISRSSQIFVILTQSFSLWILLFSSLNKLSSYLKTGGAGGALIGSTVGWIYSLAVTLRVGIEYGRQLDAETILIPTVLLATGGAVLGGVIYSTESVRERAKTRDSNRENASQDETNGNNK
jgi:hypothetical protein